jgi:hypothetical protein
MDETWYTGTIVKKSGDLGYEVAGILSIIFYIPMRHLEIKWSRRTKLPLSMSRICALVDDNCSFY